MRLYDKTHLSQLRAISHPTVQFFLPLLEQGVKHHISNIQTNLFLLEYNGSFIPITQNDKEYDNSYVVSNYYPVAAMCEKYAKRPLKRTLAQVVGLGFKALQINKVITINNWFFSSSLHPLFSSEEIEEIVSFLAQRFPYHLLSIRSIRAEEALTYQKGGLMLFKARDIYYYDPTIQENLSKQQRYRRRKDLKRLGQYELVDSPSLSDYPALLQLYRQVYMEKHTSFAPNYSSDFLELATTNGLMHLKAIRHQGKYVGVYGFCHAHEKMAVPFFGYDTSVENHQEIYCLLTSLVLEEADLKGVWLNDGTGGDVAKQRRGFQQQPEYVGLYGRHLQMPRRLIWGCANYFTTSPTKKR